MHNINDSKDILMLLKSVNFNFNISYQSDTEYFPVPVNLKYILFSF